MKWYEGSIAQAVAESRKNNAIFVVFITGNDASSEKLLNMIEEDKIRLQLESNNFVAIQIQSESQTYMQFASIYQMAPVPSIFFIGSMGTPIEIGTSIMNTSDELDEKIKKALQIHLPKTENTSTSPVPNSDVALEANSGNVTSNAEMPSKINGDNDAEQEHLCDDNACKQTKDELPKSDEKSVEKSSSEGVNIAAVNISEQVAQGALKKQQEALEKERKQEHESESRRRREAKTTQNSQEWQKKKDLIDLKENLRRDREEEKLARERIRAQIIADRAERAQLFEPVNAWSEPTAESLDRSQQQAMKASPKCANPSAEVRLQFRLLSGETKAHTFGVQDSISTVREFVRTNLLANVNTKEFALVTVYPRHEFSPDEDQKTLLELGLFPSAVILVIYKEKSTPAAIIKRHEGIVNIFNTMFWTLLSPMYSVFNYIRMNFLGNGAQERTTNDEDNQTRTDAAKRRKLDDLNPRPSTSRDAAAASQADPTSDAKPYRRYGTPNVHRLSDKRKDSDDENATWNGNSTQQQ